MTYQQFEDVPVWNEAILLAEEIYRVASQAGFKGPASFRSQIERAALSVRTTSLRVLSGGLRRSC